MNDVIKTRRNGAVFEIELDRPKANAIDLKTSRMMGEVFRDFRDDPICAWRLSARQAKVFLCWLGSESRRGR